MVSVILINGRNPQWTRNPPVPVAKEIMAGVGAVVVAVIVMLIHKLAWRAAVGVSA